MMNSPWATIPATVGITFAAFVGLSTPTIAASITRIPGDPANTPNRTPDGWTDLDWVARGRASAPGDWEFGTTTAGPITSVVQQTDWTWVNGEEVSWDLFWDATENKMTFSIGGQALVIDQTGPAEGIFNGFLLSTTSRTDPKVDPGTEMFLQVNQVNGMAVGTDVTSGATAPETSGQIISNLFYGSDEAITSLSGFARMSWLTGTRNPQQSSARDRVAFRIEGFDSGTANNVPEPTTILGLMVLGGGAVAGPKALSQDS